MKTTSALGAAVLAALLISGCAKKPDPDSFGGRLLKDGGETAAIGEKWIQGANLIEKGLATISDGEADVDRGERLVAAGKKKIRKGKALVTEGERSSRRPDPARLFSAVIRGVADNPCARGR